LPEPSFIYRFFEIDVGGSDDANVRLLHAA
jgi:hypothetical protein